MTKETLGDRIKSLRLEKNVGQKQLAGEIGYSAGIISMWERGLREPGCSAVIKLCEFFGVSADYLLGLTDF